MSIREFKGTDIDQILSIWNTAMPYNSISKKLFIKNILLDVNFDKKGFLVSEKNNTIDGFIYGLRRRLPVDIGGIVEEDTGWICAIGIKDANEILTLGSQLISECERFFKQCGISTVKACGYSPNYWYQGINSAYPEYVELFSKNDYTVIEKSVSRGINLANYRTPDDIVDLKKKRESEGFVFTHLQDQYIPSLLDFSNSGWRHRFRRLINECFDYERINLCVYNDEVIGVNVFGDPNSSHERFGPFGVSEKFRGLGLGKILLTDCLETMKNRSLHCAWMQWSETDNVPNFLYAKIGFKVDAEYLGFAKTVTL